MNDAKYSYSIHGKEMAITLLRSPIYAHHVRSSLGHGTLFVHRPGHSDVNYAAAA